MASFKPVVKKGIVNSDHKANIKIRVSHKGPSRKAKVRYIATPHYIEPKFMGDDGIIKAKFPGHNNLNKSLRILMQQYEDMAAEYQDIEEMDVNSLISKLKARKEHGSDFLAYMKFRIKQLISENRFSYAESYQVTIDHIEAFSHKNEILFKEITFTFLRDFESYLKQVRKSKVNTCRIYLNNIRAVFYHAIDNDIIKPELSPFRKFKIQQEKTKPRPLDLPDLRALLLLHPGITKRQLRAIDVFFLIFYLCGINLKDLLYLKPEDLYKGRIVYKRFKTGRDYSIKVFPPAQEIIDKYRGEKYLLSFLDKKEKDSPLRMPEADHDVLSQINKLLKTIAKNAGMEFKPSTYSARYSWATLAAKLGVSRDVIAHALGHGIDTMTDIYIDFDMEKVDQANELVISKLRTKLINRLLS